MKMKKKIALIIVIILVIVIVTFFGTNKESVLSEKPTVKIGVILPLTGDSSIMGRNTKYGIELAQEKNNNTNIEYKIIYENDNFESKKSVLAFNKLSLVDKVNSLITVDSNAGLSVAPLALDKNILQFNVISSAPEVAKGKTNFLHWTMPDMEGKKLVEKYKELNIKKVAIVTQNHPGAIAIQDGAIPHLEKENIEYKKYIVNPGVKDLRITLEKIKKYNPDTILVEMLPPLSEIFMKQRAEMGSNTPICY